MEAIALTTEMMVVLAVLGFAVFLFVSEIVRVDVAAILVMVLIGVLSYLPGLDGMVDISQLFVGFSSNAVISIIAVMILGAGLDKTGIMNRVAAVILKYGGSTEGRIIPIISGTVAFISSFMQNVGAAALFLPVVSRISSRVNIPMSRLLMPMGFCAILGGTMTMVGSSPMILLNDLIIGANADLPEGAKMATFDLFDATPVGLALVLTGIIYFVIFGRFVLPVKSTREDIAAGMSMEDYLSSTYSWEADLVEVVVPEGNILIGQTITDVMIAHHMYIIGVDGGGKRMIAPPLDAVIEPPCRLAILGRLSIIQEICDIYGLEVRPRLEVFAEDFAESRAGIGEVVVPPGSNVIGKSAWDLSFRRTYGMSLLAIHRAGVTLSHVHEDDDAISHIGRETLLAGDTLVVHTPWDQLVRMRKRKEFVVVTSDFPHEELRPKKVGWALLFFAIALSLVLFSDLRLSLCLLVGAVGMVLSRVLSIDEAYEAVSWQTVFLLASLIPLGMAVQNSGTAEWIAQKFLALLNGWPVWSLQAAVAVLATVFTLVMSNVGATVLLVPIAVSIAVSAGGDPALFALTVAISTSNSFLIPTHQVNALIMGPAGYRVADFMRAGGIMTLLFLVVSQATMQLVY